MPRNEPIDIAYSELPDSPRKQFDTEQGFTAVRELLCQWSHADRLAAQLLGGPGMDNGGVSWRQPARFPGVPAARVQRVQVVPFHPQDVSGDGGGADLDGGLNRDAKHDLAQLTVHYATGDRQSEEGTQPHPDGMEVTETLEPDIELTALPADRLVWGSQPDSDGIRAVPPLQAPVKLNAGLAWMVRYHRVPGELDRALFELLGTVNDRPVVSRHFGYRFEPHTLLYQSFTATRRLSAEGRGEWTITLRLGYRRNARRSDDSGQGPLLEHAGGPRPLGWNGLYDITAGDFNTIHRKLIEQGEAVIGPRVLLYPPADFTRLRLTAD